MWRKTLVVVGVVLGLTFTTASACQNTTMVDGKATLITPDGHTCYMLELELTGSSGEEIGEDDYACYPKAVYDKNRVGEEFRP